MPRTPTLTLKMEVLPEHQEQVDLMTLVRFHERHWPDLRLLYAVPNGGWRNITTATKLKAEGVKPGVPDLHLPIARGGFFGLWIEMKRTKRGVVSDAQRQWHEDLRLAGHVVCVCKGSADAWSALLWYLRLPVTIPEMHLRAAA